MPGNEIAVCVSGCVLSLQPRSLSHVGTRRHLTALPDTRDASRLLTVDEVAERLTCSRRTVFRLCTSRAIPSVKIGRTRRVVASDVDDYLDALRAR